MSDTAKTEEIRDNLADYTAYTMLATRLHAIETEFDDMLCDDLTGSILEDFEGALSMVGLIINVLSSGFEEKARQIAVNEFGFECEMTEEDEEEAIIEKRRRQQQEKEEREKKRMMDQVQLIFV